MKLANPKLQLLRGIDLYCGAGGMTTGAQQSGYVRVDLAVNHWRPAIMTHSENHPATRHICAELQHVDPHGDKTLPEADVIMAGVECTHHSNAKGGSPVSDQKRSSARNVLDWVAAKKPQYLIVENVREFREWGPTRLKMVKGKKVWDKKHQQWAREADPEHKGEFFRKWVSDLETEGYLVEHRLLNAADFGEATKRIRLFVIARRGGGPITWPAPTHAAEANGKPKWRAAAEIIDWDRKAPSIFGRVRPLAEKTLMRVKIGLVKFNAPQTISDALERQGYEPFIVKYHSGAQEKWLGNSTVSAQFPLPTIDTNPRFAIAQPFIVGAGGPLGAAKPSSVFRPLKTILCDDRKFLAQPFVLQVGGSGFGDIRYHGCVSTTEPLRTIMSKNNHGVVQPYLFALDQQSGSGSLQLPGSPLSTSKRAHALAEPFVINYYGTGIAHGTSEPLSTVTTKHRHGLCLFGDKQPQRQIVTMNKDEASLFWTMKLLGFDDILFRMLDVDELARAMGLPDDYVIHGNKAEQIKQIGNMVCVKVMKAICESIGEYELNLAA